MRTEGKIVSWDGKKLVIIPAAEDVERISEEIREKRITGVQLYLDDGRGISIEQRKKIFALVADIAEYSGDYPEYVRHFLTWQFCQVTQRDAFSLSNTDMTTARLLISFLIEFCFRYSVPTKDTLLHQTDDINRYLWQCIYYRKCAVCNAPAEIHHVDRVGMGRNRKEIIHEGMKAIALCHAHHGEAHSDERSFMDKYHVHGIKLDHRLCERLKLKGEKIE